MTNDRLPDTFGKGMKKRDTIAHSLDTVDFSNQLKNTFSFCNRFFFSECTQFIFCLFNFVQCAHMNAKITRINRYINNQNDQ